MKPIVFIRIPDPVDTRHAGDDDHILPRLERTRRARQDYELPKVAEIKKVVYLSDEYFALLDDDLLARYLSVGPRVRVLHKGTVYEIVPK